MVAGVSRAILPLSFHRHDFCWRHWRSEGWDFVDGIQRVVKATYLDTRRWDLIFRGGGEGFSGIFWRDLRVSWVRFWVKAVQKKKWKNGGLKISQICWRFSLETFCENPVFFEILYGPNKKWTYLGGGFKYILFSPRKLGKLSNLTCAYFSDGWFNHQLDIHQTWRNLNSCQAGSRRLDWTNAPARWAPALPVINGVVTPVTHLFTAI